MELAFCEGKLTINIISKLYSTLEGAKYNVKQEKKKAQGKDNEECRGGL